METITFTAETGGIIKYIAIGAVLTIFAAIMAIRYLRPAKEYTQTKNHQLYFLLFGILGLISFTIFAFSCFNYARMSDIQLAAKEISIGNETFPLSDVQSARIHSEGSGMPFAGIGVNSPNSKSLILEFRNGQVKILSEDFYPIVKIAKSINARKSKD